MEEQLLQALVVSSSPVGREPGQMQAAFQYIEDFKDRAAPGEVIRVGAAFSSTDSPPPAPEGWPAETLGPFESHARHFGLQLIEHVVKHRWDGCDPQGHEDIKQGALALAEQGAGRAVECFEHFELQKISSVIAETALRAWPQRWPTLLDRLSGMAGAGVAEIDRALHTPPGQAPPPAITGHLAVVLGVFRMLSEEINTFGAALDASRKRDLTVALTESLPLIVPFLATTLNVAGNLIVRATQQPEVMAQRGLRGATMAEAVPAMAGVAAVLKEVLNTLAVYVDWIPLQMIYDGGLLVLFCHLLQLADFRQQACECLLLIVARKGHLADRAPLLSLFQNLHLITSAVPPSFAAAGEAQQTHPADTNYTFLKRLAQVVTMVGSNQLCPLWGIQGFTKTQPPNFPAYLAVLADFLTHKSIMVSSFTLPAWQQILRNDEAVRSAAVKEVIPDLLNALFMLLPKPWSPEAGYHDQQVEVYGIADFDSDQDLVDFMGHFRNNALEVVRLAASVAPHSAVAHSCALLAQVTAQPPPDASSTEETVRYFAIWDAMAALLTHMGTGCFRLLHEPGNKWCTRSIEALTAALGNLLGLGTDDPQLLFSLVSVTSAFVPLLGLMPSQYIEAMLSLVFTILGMSDPEFGAEGPTSGLSPVSKVKRKACNMLNELCKNPTPALLGMLDAVCGAAHAIIAAPDTSEMVRKMLMQAMIKAGNSLDTVEAHTAMIDQLLGSTVTDWSSAELAAIVETPESLAEHCGLFVRSSSDYNLRRQTLVLLIESICVTVTETKPRSADPTGPPPPRATLRGIGGSPAGGDGMQHASSPYTRAVLMQALRMVRAVHGLWTPIGVPDELLDVLAMRRIDFAGSLSEAGKAYRSRPSNPDEVWLDRTQLFLTTLRESCYRIVGSAARQGLLYEISPLLPTLADTCFFGLDNARASHVSLFLKLVVTPVVQFAPRSAAGMAVVVEVMAYFYGFISGFVEAEWALNDERQHGGGGGSDSQGMLAEIVDDKLLRTLTNEVMHHLGQVFGDGPPPPKGGVAASTEPVPAFGVIGHALMASVESAQPALKIMCDMLVWNNSASARSAATLIAGGLKKMAQYPAFGPVLDGYLLTKVIQGLGKHGQHDDCQLQLLNLVVAIYQCAVDNGVQSVHATLRAIPGCDPGLIDQIDAELRDTPALSTRALRNRFKAALGPMIGQHVGQALRRKSRITALPERLFLASDSKPQPDGEEGLASFFDAFDE